MTHEQETPPPHEDQRDPVRGKLWKSLVHHAISSSPKTFLVYGDLSYRAKKRRGARQGPHQRNVRVSDQGSLADVLGIDESRVNELFEGRRADIPSPLAESRVLTSLPGPGKGHEFKTRSEIFFQDIIGHGVKSEMSNEELATVLAQMQMPKENSEAPVASVSVSRWEAVVWMLQRRWERSGDAEEIQSSRIGNQPQGAVRAGMYEDPRPTHGLRIGPRGRANGRSSAVLDEAGNCLLEYVPGDFMELRILNPQWNNWFCTILVRKDKWNEEQRAIEVESLLPHWSESLVRSRKDDDSDILPNQLIGSSLHIQNIETSASDGNHLEMFVFLHADAYPANNLTPAFSRSTETNEGFAARYPDVAALDGFAAWYESRGIGTKAGFCLRMRAV